MVVTDASIGETLAPDVAGGDDSDIRANRDRAREWLVARAADTNIQCHAKVANVRANSHGVVFKLEGGAKVRGRCLVADDSVHSDGQPEP